MTTIYESKLQKSAAAFLKRHRLRSDSLFADWRNDPAAAIYAALEDLKAIGSRRYTRLASYWRRCRKRALDYGPDGIKGLAPNGKP